MTGQGPEGPRDRTDPGRAGEPAGKDPALGASLASGGPAEDDVGLLRLGRTPYIGNAEAASVFSRLNAITHEFDFTPYAAGALDAAKRRVAGQGPLTAYYLLAARQVR